MEEYMSLESSLRDLKCQLHYATLTPTQKGLYSSLQENAIYHTHDYEPAHFYIVPAGTDEKDLARVKRHMDLLDRVYWAEGIFHREFLKEGDVIPNHDFFSEGYLTTVAGTKAVPVKKRPPAP
jgi:hypothetical protein